MKGKNLFALFFALVFLIQVLLIGYFQRSYFLSTYDVSYWKDRFEHSQWQLPLSGRIIGDDGLFSYVGLNLVKGDDPSRINPETAPVGKYLIGFSIILFKNPAYYGLITGILSLLTFYFLAKRLLNNNLDAKFVVLLLFLDPLFFSQLWKAWIDMPFLLFLLINFLCLTYLKPKGKNNLLISIISGASLGLFAQTKLPILFPIILPLELFFFIKGKMVKEYLLYIFGFLVGIFLPFIQYFLLGYSIVDFLKLQKFIISFYRESGLSSHFGAIWQALLLGRFPEINGASFVKVSEWWILWPISFVGAVSSMFLVFKQKQNLLLKGLVVFVFLGLLVYGVIPSYPRYLLIIIPFLYILFTYVLNSKVKEQYKKIMFIIILIVGVINSYLFLFPKPDSLLNNFYYSYSHKYFQDIYAEDILSNSLKIDRNTFRVLSQKALENAQVKEIQIKELKRDIPMFSGTGKVIIDITYKTEALGEFHEKKEVLLTKENSQWKIRWDWNLILSKFKPGLSVVTTLENGRRGRIESSIGEVLASDEDGFLISLDPEKIDTKKEEEMLKFMSNLSGVLPVRLQNAYLENSVSGEFVPLVTLFNDISESNKSKLLSYKGVKLSSHEARLYNSKDLNSTSIINTFYSECCTRIYSSYNYEGISGPEKKYNSILRGYDGGRIEIKDKNGQVIRTSLEKQAKNGQDVILSL